MSVTSLFAVTTVVLEILPIMCHRLITNPYPDQEWDSVIVSSDPIKIRERKQNQTSSLNFKKILKPQKRSFDECPQNDFKCLYGEDAENGNNQIADKFFEQYSKDSEKHLDDLKSNENLPEEYKNENSRKSYWTMIDSQTHNHPYDDKKGWVTLDPIPWSTSKISKWHPHKMGVQQENKPWSYGPTTQRPVQQFWVSGSSFHTQKPISQWGIGSNNIITDNKPSDFPNENYNPQGLNYHSENGFYEYSGNYNDFHQNQGFKGNHPSKLAQNVHPSTYPSNGNGEWILLSTTKGYSLPQRHRWAGKADGTKFSERLFASRNIKPVEISRYHEEDLKEKFESNRKNSLGNRKSDEYVNSEEDVHKPNLNNKQNSDQIPVQILYTGSSKNAETSKTFKRKVRLQVLPSLQNSTTSHGGILEVDSKKQTVDEAQQEDENLKKLKTIANIKKNRIRGYKLVPTNKGTGKAMNHKNAMTLAAVGAGMIPATMALLVPMALGRKKRSLSNELISYEKIYSGKQT